MLMFERAAGVKLTHVPSREAPNPRRDMGKQIDVAADERRRVAAVDPRRRADANLGQFAPRARTRARLPTGREQGFPFEMVALRGMAAPKGMPADILERLVKQ